MYFFKNKGNKKRAFSKISDSVQPYERQDYMNVTYNTRKRMLNIWNNLEYQGEVKWMKPQELSTVADGSLPLFIRTARVVEFTGTIHRLSNTIYFFKQEYTKISMESSSMANWKWKIEESRVCISFVNRWTIFNNFSKAIMSCIVKKLCQKPMDYRYFLIERIV